MPVFDPTPVIHNERAKLLATALNNLGVATIITAVIGQVVGILNGSSSTAVNVLWALGGLVWLFVGLIFHLIAHLVLGSLRL